MVFPITDRPKSAFMPGAIADQFFIRNFVTVKQLDNDTGPEIISDGQGLSFCVLLRRFMHYFKKLIETLLTNIDIS